MGRTGGKPGVVGGGDKRGRWWVVVGEWEWRREAQGGAGRRRAARGGAGRARGRAREKVSWQRGRDEGTGDEDQVRLGRGLGALADDWFRAGAHTPH